jgi:ABC-type uncharacterized transport system permease subunit
MGIGLIIIGVAIWIINLIMVNSYFKFPQSLLGIIPGALLSGLIIGFGLRLL